MVKSSSTWIGIDLGSLNSCVGVFRPLQNRVEIVPNDQGNRITPSCVSFSQNGRLVGESARGQAPLNPKNTIWYTNRLLGYTYHDGASQFPEARPAPFRLVNSNNRPHIRVDYREQQRDIAPEEIASAVLQKLKETAESYLGEKVTHAAIAIPSTYSYRQRQATRDAATIAGLMAYLINDTNATAIAYYHLWPSQAEKNVLVIDMGATTTSVNLLTLEAGVLEVKATTGDLRLGGEDFDDRIVKHFVGEFRRTTGKDMSHDARAIRRLRTACERGKCSLSAASQVGIEIDSLFEGADLYFTLSRSKFEELCADLFRGLLDPLERVLRDSKIDRGQVDEIVFLGGCSRIPKLQTLVTDFFNGKEIFRALNPDEAVVYGAAVQAAIWSGAGTKALEDMLLLTGTVSTLGIETTEGNNIDCSYGSEPHLRSQSMPQSGDLVMHPLLKRYTTLPTKKSEIFTTHHNDQTTVLVQLYEGERTRTQDNAFLCQVELEGMLPVPRGVPQIEVCLDVVAAGDIELSVKDLATGRGNRAQITHLPGCLSPSDIDRMLEDARRYKAEDEASFSRIQARDDLENYAYQLRDDIKNGELINRADAIDLAVLEFAIDEITSWVGNASGATREECQFSSKSIVPEAYDTDGQKYRQLLELRKARRLHE